MKETSWRTVTGLVYSFVSQHDCASRIVHCYRKAKREQVPFIIAIENVELCKCSLENLHMGTLRLK